ncbi:MAG: prepilin-type N-terminal cleavage/methylation domain-containing protein, partial [Gammaproteobacteria bacterium]
MTHRTRGFTLMEVLVALVIVALGAAAVLGALRTAA